MKTTTYTQFKFGGFEDCLEGDFSEQELLDKYINVFPVLYRCSAHSSSNGPVKTIEFFIPRKR